MPDKGRIDWKPKLAMWRAIGYKGSRDITIGDYLDKVEAIKALREWVSK